MATVINGYNVTAELIGKGLLPFNTLPFKLALLDATYTFNSTHNVWVDVSASEIDPITYTSYTASGKALTNQSFTEFNGIGTFDADDTTWLGDAITCRTGILYVDQTIDVYAKPLIARIIFDDSPADVSREDFTIMWPSTGIISLPKSA